ncbi:MAG: methyltransferase [Bacteroidales bacterium]|nr:methyltransferase [Bacteroidales bacterium]
MFHFKQFNVSHEKSSMKVGTDAILLGCLADVSGNAALEVGCGCGVISLMLAQRFQSLKITAIDIHKPSVEEAFENFQNSIWNGRLSVENKPLQEFSANFYDKFDAIVSNPPFFSKSLQSPNTDRTNARHATTLTYDNLILCSEKLLTPQGKLSVIIPMLEYANFQKRIAQSKLQIHRILHVFGANKENPKRAILECGFEKNPLVEKSFFLHNNSNNYSDEYLELTKDFLFLNHNK